MAVLALFLAALLSTHLARPDRPVEKAWDGRTRAIHEWGTFVSVQGSDGVALRGLRHHDRDLPPFVHGLEKRGGITTLQLKMETPVVYFHAPGTWRLDVDVRFPRGLVTEWWPTAARVNDPCAREAGAVEVLTKKPEEWKDGFVAWGRRCDLVVLPRDAEVELAPVDPADPWGFARDVAANPLRVARRIEAERQPERYGPEHEKLLFYRGLGDFPLPLSVRVRSESRRVDERGGAVRSYELDLELAADSERLRGLFVVEVDGDRAGFARLGDLAAGRSVVRELALRPCEDADVDLARAIASELERAGLFTDEARAMTRTWAHAWFREPGLRVLYVVPAALVERELPLTISHSVLQTADEEAWTPAPPESVVRVFVARTEVLTRAEERGLIETLSEHARGDPRARAEIAAWGRYALPRLERARALAPEGPLRSAAAALVAQHRAH